MMRAIAPAKINLNLSITGRRDDGYHLLDSIMVFTEWGDEIIMTPSSEFRLTADGPYSNIFTAQLLSTDKGSPNLIVRAVYLMAEKAGKTPDFHIHVIKNIPAGAGLGGGSSDAAVVMRMLNDYWALDLSMEELCGIGLQIGAEIPVCLHARSMHVKGIGEDITPIDLPSMTLLIAWPEDGLLTKDVFAAYKESELPFTKAFPFIGDINTWLEKGNNDLTAAAIELCPTIGTILSDLQEIKGCLVARMSGSGSACFAIFKTHEEALKSAKNFKSSVVTSIKMDTAQ